MKKQFLLGALLAATAVTPAAAQDAASCEAMLKDFDAKIESYNVSSDLQIQGARTQIQELCLSGDQAAAEAKANEALAHLESGEVSPGTVGTTTTTDTDTGATTGTSGATGSTGTTGTTTTTQ